MHYMVEIFAANEHNELEMQINNWLRTKRPSRIIKLAFVADGTAFTFCVLLLYVPREKPLPK